jgi:hypothetical protein
MSFFDIWQLSSFFLLSAANHFIPFNQFGNLCVGKAQLFGLFQQLLPKFAAGIRLYVIQQQCSMFIFQLAMYVNDGAHSVEEPFVNSAYSMYTFHNVLIGQKAFRRLFFRVKGAGQGEHPLIRWIFQVLCVKI